MYAQIVVYLMTGDLEGIIPIQLTYLYPLSHPHLTSTKHFRDSSAKKYTNKNSMLTLHAHTHVHNNAFN